MQLTQKNLIASQAWEVIKAAGDPSWLGCQLPHRETLIAQLEALLGGGSARNPFEIECKKILEQMEVEAAEERALAEKSAAETRAAAEKKRKARGRRDTGVDRPSASSSKKRPAKARAKK